MASQFLCVILTLATGHEAVQTNLFHDVLLQGYNRNIRPKHGLINQRTHIYVEVNFLSIDSVDMKKQTILVDLTPRLRWTDERLR